MLELTLDHFGQSSPSVASRRAARKIGCTLNYDICETYPLNIHHTWSETASSVSIRGLCWSRSQEKAVACSYYWSCFISCLPGLPIFGGPSCRLSFLPPFHHFTSWARQPEERPTKKTAASADRRCARQALSWCCTALASPPMDWGPQQSTCPSARRAAKAAAEALSRWVTWGSCLCEKDPSNSDHLVLYVYNLPL